MITLLDMQLSDTTKEILFLLLAMFIGALASIGALLFRGAIEFGQWLLWPPGLNFLGQVQQAPWWLKLGLPVLGGLAVGPLVTYYVPEVRGPGVPEVIEAAALHQGYIRPQVTVLKPVCTAIIIATGGSVGREGPAVHIGSAIGSLPGRILSMPIIKGYLKTRCLGKIFEETFPKRIPSLLAQLRCLLPAALFTRLKSFHNRLIRF